METKFLTYFSLSQDFLFANLYLIVTNDSLTIAHLNIEPICANTSDVIIFAESVVFYSRFMLRNLNLPVSITKKDIDKQ